MRSSSFALLCFLVLFCSSFAGHARTRLIYTGSDVNKPARDTLNIKNIHRGFLKNVLIVKLQDKTKMKIPANSVWGYEAKDHSIYRYSNGDFIEVKDAGAMIIYAEHHSKHTYWFFSKTVDSEVFRLTTKNLKKQFADNTCFLAQLKSVKWYQDYADYNRHNKHYRIESLYENCGG